MAARWAWIGAQTGEPGWRLTRPPLLAAESALGVRLAAALAGLELGKKAAA